MQELIAASILNLIIKIMERIVTEDINDAREDYQKQMAEIKAREQAAENSGENSRNTVKHTAVTLSRFGIEDGSIEKPAHVQWRSEGRNFPPPERTSYEDLKLKNRKLREIALYYIERYCDDWGIEKSPKSILKQALTNKKKG